MMTPSNGVFFHLCISCTHDSFCDVAVRAAFPHGISPHEGVGACVGVDSTWFIQLCIHVLERGLSLEAKGNPRNVKFALGDLHLV
jgi:hypothetical protein